MKEYLDHNKLDLYQNYDIPVDDYEHTLETKKCIDSWMNSNKHGPRNVFYWSFSAPLGMLDPLTRTQVEGKYRLEGRFGKTYRFTKFGDPRQWKLSIITDIAFTLASEFKFFNVHGLGFKPMDPSEEAISYYFGNYLLTPLALSEGQIEKSIFFILDFTLLDSTEPIDPVVSLIKLLSQLPPKIRFLILGLERGNDGKCIRYSGTHMVPLLAQSTNM